MRLIITDRTKFIYSMYRACEVSIHRACGERATQPFSLGGEVRFIQAQDQQMLPHVAECLLTRSMLIKIITISGYVHVYVQLCLQSSQFHADVYLVYFVFHLA